MTDLSSLRQQLRAGRRALTEEERVQRSQAAVQNLAHHRVFLSAKHIACYLPNDGELDLTFLISQAWAMGKSVYLPVLSIHHRNHLHFISYTAEDELVPNRFGIPEPVLRSRNMIDTRRLDLVLMPLVGFDSSGNRLGMGGGFYDRSFAFLRRRQKWRKPNLVGAAFDCQKVEQLSTNTWDVPLTGVMTESGVSLF
ncbi:5-formyltetrahydrofolate cyclo-ligase [Kaarinaea lacus]